MTQRQICVHLHGQAIEIAAMAKVHLKLEANSTVGALKLALAAEIPQLKLLLPACAVANHAEYFHEDALLDDAPEFHLIPPVSGG